MFKINLRWMIIYLIYKVKNSKPFQIIIDYKHNFIIIAELQINLALK